MLSKFLFILCLIPLLAVVSCRCSNHTASEVEFRAYNKKIERIRQSLESNCSKESDLNLKQLSPFKNNITVNGPNELTLELVYIDPGCFRMGSDRRHGWFFRTFHWDYHKSWDYPARKVTITKGFYIGKYKVTVAQYCKFLNSACVKQPHELIAGNIWARIINQDGKYIPKPGTEDMAVNTVPWCGAVAFCKWLSHTTGHCFRLPTDAEWEFTARGPEGRFYPSGDRDSSPRSRGLWENDRNNSESWKGRSVYSIAEKSPFNVTPDGVVGMAGAVGEWVSDYFSPKHPDKDEIDPTGPQDPPVIEPCGNPPYRVLRRSLFTMTERSFGLDVSDDAGVYGFRVLMEVDGYQEKTNDIMAENTK